MAKTDIFTEDINMRKVETHEGSTTVKQELANYNSETANNNKNMEEKNMNKEEQINAALEQDATIMEQLKNSEIKEECMSGKNQAKSTLLIRLGDIFQSWGADPEFETKREPTKNGIVELLARALGRNRDDDISDLCNLRFGVRIDKEGSLMKKDFYEEDDWTGELSEQILYYLVDPVFLVGLESNDEKFLEDLIYAVNHPQRLIFLGKNDCPPGPLAMSIRHTDLETALSEEPWQTLDYYQQEHESNPVFPRLIMDSTIDEMTGIKKDFPISYGQYAWRPVVEKDLEIANTHACAERDRCYRRYVPIDHPTEAPEKSTEESPDETVDRLTKLAETGNAEDEYNLACFYSKEVGDCYEPHFMLDEKKAVEWFTKAAEQGLAEAQYNLGLFYYFGWNNFKNIDCTKARKWLQKAADQGYQDAETFLELYPPETDFPLGIR